MCKRLLLFILLCTLCGCKSEEAPSDSSTYVHISDRESTPISEYGYVEYKPEDAANTEVLSVTGNTNVDAVIAEIMTENSWVDANVVVEAKDPNRDVWYYNVIFDDCALYTFSVDDTGTVYSNVGDYAQYLRDTEVYE